MTLSVDASQAVKIDWFADTLSELASRAQRQRLHHGLLFIGQRGIGKQVSAHEMAGRLLCKQVRSDNTACGACQSCDLMQAGSHPDFYWLTTDKTQIGVDLIRSAIQSLSSKAQLSHNKVLIIPDAHLLSDAAANALLKTLEEPTPSTFIILVTHQHNRLLPTILSRCEKVIFNTPTTAESLDWLAKVRQDDAMSLPQDLLIDERSLAAYGGAPLLLLDSAEAQNAITFTRFIDTLKSIESGQSAEVDLLDVSTRWQNDAEQVIIWLQRYCHQQARQQSRDSLATDTDTDYWQLYTQTTQAAQKVRHAGTNKSMLLFELFNTFREATHYVR
ncbi:DNA polymerase III subunit delta' [Alteromonas oceanisediminis]|uniref:DNA polymerase III subunit delta' n=1 Tax=Alteromonas oceanisediminis TaxID=2836180 RepID=UPI001BD99E1C|nr:DNA polymerase III subunit delta' [Alteromonas oceanisediminis]MBT0586429.1 DNA polymerase III subunit delta' [Alteromonas oceanisediminis]